MKPIKLYRRSPPGAMLAKTQKQIRAEYKKVLREIGKEWKAIASMEINPFRENLAAYYMAGMEAHEIQSFSVKLGWARALAWALGIGEPEWTE